MRPKDIKLARELVDLQKKTNPEYLPASYRFLEMALDDLEPLRKNLMECRKMAKQLEKQLS